MTILITGATGLIGGRLLPRLIAAGQPCRALLRGGKPVPFGAAVAEGDLMDASSLAQAVAGATAIIHLAAVFRTQDEALIWRSNLDGTRHLIAAAQAHAPRARFILASTCHVYNKDGTHPGREDDEVRPTQAYPASKVAAEQALRESGLDWTVLRLPFVYGDGDGHLEMLPKHVGDWHPAQRMSLLHHQDVATAIAMALRGVFDGRTVNVTDEAPTSVGELIRLAGGEPKRSAEPLPNPWYLHADASLARSMGFQPNVRTIYQATQQSLM